MKEGGGQRKRVPRIRWERLEGEEDKETYRKITEEMMMERSDENSGQWEGVSGLILEAAKEVCGLYRGGLKPVPG